MIHNALKKDAAKTANLTDKEKKKIEREKKRAQKEARKTAREKEAAEVQQHITDTFPMFAKLMRYGLKKMLEDPAERSKCYVSRLVPNTNKAWQYSLKPYQREAIGQIQERLQK